MGSPTLGRAIPAVVAAALVVVAALGVGRLLGSTHDQPFDFDLNWVAAHRLVDGEEIYDRASSRRDAIELVSREMVGSNDTPFESFIGAPVVALVHVPFVAVERDVGVDLFRVLSFLAMLVAVAVISRILPIGSRALGAIVGTVAVLVLHPATSTLAFGQTNGFVLLALAIGTWGIVRERPVVAGIAFGFAIAMKLPLVFVLGYLAVRGRRSLLIPAGCTVAAMSIAAAMIGRGSELVTWARDVLPAASRGSAFHANQSLPAWIERVSSSTTDFNEHVPLGALYRVGPLIAVLGLAALARRCRGMPIDPMEVGVALLVVLVAGPLSWDHYYVWVVLPLVLACDRERWQLLRGHRGLVAVALGAGVAILSFRIAVPSGASIAADGSLRLGTGAYVVAGGLMLAAGAALLAPRRTCVRIAGPPDTMAGLWRTRSSSGAPGSTTSATSTWSSRATG